MEPSESGKKPGEILTIGKESLHIAVKGGMIKIGKVRVDKGEKIGPIEFAQSVNAKVGDELGK
jgi:methionyl-tRNA formyltransferase